MDSWVTKSGLRDSTQKDIYTYIYGYSEENKYTKNSNKKE